MRLEGTIEIAASVGSVWPVVTDPRDLATCVPGVRGLQRMDDSTFEGTLEIALGPMRGAFDFRAAIAERELGRALAAVVDGRDSVTRSDVRVTIEVVLEPVTPSTTRLSYDAVVEARGRIAILGEMVLRATASHLIAHVVACLRARLEPAASAI